MFKTTKIFSEVLRFRNVSELCHERFCAIDGKEVSVKCLNDYFFKTIFVYLEVSVINALSKG